MVLCSTPVPDADLVQVSDQEKNSVQEEDDNSELLKEEFDELKLQLKERESIAGFNGNETLSESFSETCMLSRVTLS